MPSPFSRTLRSLEADRRRPRLLLLGPGVVLAALWTGWLFLARVQVVEVAEAARIEVAQRAYAVQAEVGGRVVASHLSLGRDVRAGDVLVEIDTEALSLSLDEQHARRAAIAGEVAALQGELGAEEDAVAGERLVAGAVGEEARARSRQAQVVAELTERETERSAALRESGLLSEVAAKKTEAEAAERRAAAEATRISVGRFASEYRVTQGERRVRIARLRRNIAELEGQLKLIAVTVKKLEHDIELRRVHAPADGRLGEIADLSVGSVLREGERIGVVVPADQLRVVASFLPAHAVGRIQPGQRARLRLDGFPWTQYGMLAAAVTEVGNEPRDGRIRVELAIREAESSSLLPLTHGLTGVAEVEIERVSPATLAIRAAGGLLSPARP
jgi:membrane fusion protein (multidrug efflux system)